MSPRSIRPKGGQGGDRPAGRTAAAVLAGGASAVLLAVVAPVAPSGKADLFSLDRDGLFPHEEHAGLFPTCLGCHAGVATGESERHYTVVEADCATCHDGSREERVEWRLPSGSVTNLGFTHTEHVSLVAEESRAALACQDCHAAAEAERRMEVVLARAGLCLACHAEGRREAPVDHLSRNSDCLACHRRLAEADALPVSRIAAFPEPSDHEEAGFVQDHGETAVAATTQCSVCHARGSCARCHLNGRQLDAVVALQPDERVLELLAGRPGEWPEPESHLRADFALAHGDVTLGSLESCANCHARPSCVSCHGSPGPAWLAALPRPVPGGPPGAVMKAARPPGHDPFFATTHGVAASADIPSCSSCHRQTECADCHDRVPAGALPHPLPGTGGVASVLFGAASAAGIPRSSPTDTVETEAKPDTTERPTSGEREKQAAARTAQAGSRARDPGRGPRLGPFGDVPDPASGFHPPNFVLRHGAEAFAALTECADCHSREVFCRACHERSGFAATRPRSTGGAFHDAQSDWFLAHGMAARQNLEACTSCHRQSSCLRCHSARAGLRVSPHGPGFDPDRVADRSTISCGVCHFADQVLPPP